MAGSGDDRLACHPLELDCMIGFSRRGPTANYERLTFESRQIVVVSGTAISDPPINWVVLSSPCFSRASSTSRPGGGDSILTTSSASAATYTMETALKAFFSSPRFAVAGASSGRSLHLFYNRNANSSKTHTNLAIKVHLSRTT